MRYAMIKRILIIGGYGNFGQFIGRILAREGNIQLILAGRNIVRAQSLADTLEARNKPEVAFIDINTGLADALVTIKPDIVIHTSGPYQGQDYHVAKACIDVGAHYIDLADARGFVCGIDAMDKAAKDNKVLVCSGASSVPCLTSAVIDKYIGEFEALESVEYAIATAQRTGRGLATMSAVLSYAGKPFKTLVHGEMRDVYGWLGLKWRKFWGLGFRPLGDCDIPDLELFPKRYPTLKNVRFRAGLEIKVMHLGLVFMSWLVKVGVIKSIQPLAPLLLKISYLFDPFGVDDSGFYMKMDGRGKDGAPKTILFELLAHKGDGLNIPAMPAILLAKKLANGEVDKVGATPCVDLITLDEYLDDLSAFDIEWHDDIT